MGEVAGVAGQKRGVVSESDASDLQVQRAKAQTLPAKLQEQIGCVGVPGEDHPVSEDLDLPVQFRIAGDLAVRIMMAAYLSEPTSHLFLDGNYGNGYVGPGRFQAGAQPHPSG